MSDLKGLYTAIVKTHNEKPFHFEKKEGSSDTLRAYNPICGDRFDLYIDAYQDKIKELHFYGFGCAVSKASTSVLTKSLEGKSWTEGLTICSNFLEFIDKQLDGNPVLLSEDFKAFGGVHDFPERYDCATLSWKEMKRFLESKMAQEQNRI